MSLHKPIVNAALKSLQTIFCDGQHADKVLEHTLKANRSFGARDRRFLAESVYDIVRWWRRLWAVIEKEPGQGISHDLQHLRLVFAAWLICYKKIDLPDWPEFKGVDAQSWIARNREIEKRQDAISLSVPDWLFSLCESEFGAEKCREVLSALNQAAPVVLRANTIKSQRAQLQKALQG